MMSSASHKNKNVTNKRELVPLGKKKLGVCGRMPGDPQDQIDFTKEGNTVGLRIVFLFVLISAYQYICSIILATILFKGIYYKCACIFRNTWRRIWRRRPVLRSILWFSWRQYAYYWRINSKHILLIYDGIAIVIYRLPVMYVTGSI